VTDVANAPRALASSPDGQRRIAMLLMLLFAVLWAVIEGELGVRLRQPYDLTQIVWSRYASHLLLVYAFWGVRQPSRLWRTARLRLQLRRSLLMLVMPLSFGAAVAYAGEQTSVWAAFWCAPLLILVFARIIAGERVPVSVWMLTVLASVGTVLILAPSAAPAGKALAFALLMAVSFALYVVLTRMLRHETLSANLFYTAVGVLLPLSLYVPRIWVMPSAHDAVILFGIGAVGLAALAALDRAVERAESSLSAAFVTAQVPTALLILWSRQSTLVSRQTLLGLAAVAVSLLAMWRFGSRADPIAE
jgi:drug/metabolite transporter (DMT)-like permease